MHIQTYGSCLCLFSHGNGCSCPGSKHTLIHSTWHDHSGLQGQRQCSLMQVQSKIQIFSYHLSTLLFFLSYNYFKLLSHKNISVDKSSQIDIKRKQWLICLNFSSRISDDLEENNLLESINIDQPKLFIMLPTIYSWKCWMTY